MIHDFAVGIWSHAEMPTSLIELPEEQVKQNAEEWKNVQ